MMNNMVLQIEGMSCGGCVASVQGVLLGCAGVREAVVELASGQAMVVFDEAVGNLADLVAAVEEAGFDVQVVA